MLSWKKYRAVTAGHLCKPIRYWRNTRWFISIAWSARNGNSSIFDLFDFAIIDEGIDNLLNLIILQLDIGDARASHERSHAFEGCASLLSNEHVALFVQHFDKLVIKHSILKGTRLYDILASLEGGRAVRPSYNYDYDPLPLYRMHCL